MKQRGYRAMPRLLKYRGWVACWRCGRWTLGSSTCSTCEGELSGR